MLAGLGPMVAWEALELSSAQWPEATRLILRGPFRTPWSFQSVFVLLAAQAAVEGEGRGPTTA